MTNRKTKSGKPGKSASHDTRIRQLPRLRNIPIIACTAYNQWEWRSKAILAGCTDFLTKPLESRVLLAMLSRYLYREGDSRSQR